MRAPTEPSKREHKASALFAAVKDKVTGVCSFCAGAFGATQGVKACGLLLAAEYEGHPSLRKLVGAGYDVITF